jgi:hypothetical protein
MNEIDNYKQLFDRNIERVRSLRKLYSSLKNDEIKEGKEYKFTDVLRSAVVLLHSSFEEYYRSVLGYLAPKLCTEDDLKNISFPGSEGKHREKVTLGEILKFRGKTVDQLITESIQESLKCTSFNDYADIVLWAKKIKIDLSKFKSQDKLNKLIKRRHQIVHEADNAKSDDKYSLSQIRDDTVEDWIEIVCSLVAIINIEIHKEED